MTNHISNEVLAHYGVLGMKWGVRKDGKPQGYQGGDDKPNRSNSKAIKKAQKKWDKKNKHAVMEAHNRAADKVNSGESSLIRDTNAKIDTLMKREKVSNIASLSNNGKKIYERILQEYSRDFDELTTSELREIMKTRPS